MASKCIIAKGKLDKDGYGRTWVNGHSLRAHRVVYEAAFGKIDGVIDHLCRNRACINIEHLEVVTTAENTRRGERAKINHNLAATIRDMYAKGNYTQANIGTIFGIGQDEVSRIINNKRWSTI